MTRDRRNSRIVTVADIALYITAQAYTDGIDKLNLEYDAAYDGPDIGDTTGRSTNATSTTERNAQEAERLSGKLVELRTALVRFEEAHRALRELAERACRIRAFNAEEAPPPEIPVCRDNQQNKRGGIEWGDATCILSPIKDGLCIKHYTAWYRYRKRHGIDTTRDFAA